MPLACRRVLEQKLTLNRDLYKCFLEGLERHLADVSALHAALKPMRVTGVSCAVQLSPAWLPCPCLCKGDVHYR